MHRLVPVLLGAVFILAPLGAKAADLLVWEKGFYAQEDQAVRETIAAFEQGSGKQVDLVFYEQAQLPQKTDAALAAGQPPDFAFGTRMQDFIMGWAFDDGLVDLTGTVGHLSDLFDPVALWWWELVNKTGQTALYALPMGRVTNHVHVWKSLLEQAGFTLADSDRAIEFAYGIIDHVAELRQAQGETPRLGLADGTRPSAFKRSARP